MIVINDKHFGRPDEMENNKLKAFLNKNLKHYKSLQASKNLQDSLELNQQYAVI